MKITLNPGESTSVYTTSEVYDCSTKKYDSPYIKNSNYNTSYGYKASVKGNIEIITDKKTFLVKT